MAVSANLNDLTPDHLLTLYQITITMNSSLDFDEVLNTVMDSVMQITKAQRGVLMVADDNAVMQARVERGIDGDPEAVYSRTIINQVVETRQSLLTNNAQFDERYTAGQSIILRGLRAILCAPMLVKGRIIGVIYVDTALRFGVFTEADHRLLDAVAGQAGVAIENARLYLVAVEKGRLDKELQLAREIQESLLPRRVPELPGYDVAARWRSAREVAGDFYDFLLLDNGSLGVVIADVSDKGAPAALFMASARGIIRSHAFSGFDPLETLARANRMLLEDGDGGMFVTVYYSVLNPDGTSLHINAGHNPPLLFRRHDRRLQTLPIGGRAMGWFVDNPLKQTDIQLQTGDVLVYYTDGLTDAESVAGESFGVHRLAQAIIGGQDQSAEDILTRIVELVDEFCIGAPVFDDLTLCVIRYLGA